MDFLINNFVDLYYLLYYAVGECQLILQATDHLLANVNLCSRLLYVVVVRPSVCRLSVVCRLLSVCNVRAPYSAD